jgi:hypothetical protein
MSSFYEGVRKVLESSIVKFNYIKDNLSEREFITTLNPAILSQYYQGDFVSKMLRGVELRLDRGYVKLPELGISKYDDTGIRSLNLSRITKVEVLQDFDARYIEVDFNTIHPAFRETVANMSDRLVLSTIYQDLTGQDPQVTTTLELRESILSFTDGQVAVGTTMALRYLHDYMVQRKQFFPLYNDGKPIQYDGLFGGNSGFNLGVIK